MIIYEGIGGLVLFLAMAVLAIYFYGRLCRDAGYEEGRSDAYDGVLGRIEAEPVTELELQEHAGELTPGRHARTQPRQQPPWIPGPDHPQPGRNSGPGTAQLPRYGSIAFALQAAGVRPRLGLPATTGEITAVTDQLIADAQAQAAADRAAVVSAFREPLPSEQETADAVPRV